MSITKKRSFKKKKKSITIRDFKNFENLRGLNAIINDFRTFIYLAFNLSLKMKPTLGVFKHFQYDV